MFNLLTKKNIALDVFDECIQKTVIENKKLTPCTKEKTLVMYNTIKKQIPQGVDIKKIDFTFIEAIKAKWQNENVSHGTKPYKASTINRRLSHIKKVLTYAYNMDYIKKVPIIDYVKEAQQDVSYFTTKDFKKICDAIKKDLVTFEKGTIQSERQKKSEMLYFSLYLMGLTGLRPTEFAKAKWSEYNQKKQQLVVPSFSRNKSTKRTIKISNRCAKFLNSDSFKYSKLYICPFRKKNISHVRATLHMTQALTALVKRHKLKLSTERVCIRMLRSSFTTWAISENMNKNLIATYLGHSSEDQLKKYVNKQAVLDSSENVKAVKQLKLLKIA